MNEALNYNNPNIPCMECMEHIYMFLNIDLHLHLEGTYFESQSDYHSLDRVYLCFSSVSPWQMPEEFTETGCHQSHSPLCKLCVSGTSLYST
jgi:hypothetical protein